MLNSIKNYLSKAKEEATREHTISPGERKKPDTGGKSGYDPDNLPAVWTGVDLDGTLALFDAGSSLARIGRPVVPVLNMVKKMIANGERVKIFTARAQDPEQIPLIRQWLKQNGLPELEITNVKDYNMIRLYDDRCIQVESNTGRIIE